ncbi:hypothetical protein HMI54_001015 [Coelomomyces lativittatus]|nr:hypothetical protein HMI54_001015 [Coelomomyces lativittatus]
MMGPTSSSSGPTVSSVPRGGRGRGGGGGGGGALPSMTHGPSPPNYPVHGHAKLKTKVTGDEEENDEDGLPSTRTLVATSFSKPKKGGGGGVPPRYQEGGERSAERILETSHPSSWSSSGPVPTSMEFSDPAIISVCLSFLFFFFLFFFSSVQERKKRGSVCVPLVFLSFRPFLFSF